MLETLTQPLRPQSGSRFDDHTHYLWNGLGPGMIIEDVTDVRIGGITLSCPHGGGVYINRANWIRFTDTKINAWGGDAWHLHDGNGLFLRGTCHTNGTPGLGTRAVKVDGQWDTVGITGLLAEEHDSGIRLGGPVGSVANIKLTDVTLDRLGQNGVGLHIEPHGTGLVWKVQATQMWTAGSHAMLLDSTKSGAVNSIQQVILGTWLGTETPNRVWVVGQIVDFRIAPTAMILLTEGGRP